MRVPSMKGYFFSVKSTPFITSVYALPPQSLVISSVNFCPYPVDPRRLIISVTYPAAEKTCAFHRYPHAFGHIVRGSPCSRQEWIFLCRVKSWRADQHGLHFRSFGAFKPECFRGVHFHGRKNGIILMRQLPHFEAVARCRENFRRHRQARPLKHQCLA